jgi:hypothetical protein
VEFRNGLSSLHNAQEIAAGAKLLDDARLVLSGLSGPPQIDVPH